MEENKDLKMNKGKKKKISFKHYLAFTLPYVLFAALFVIDTSAYAADQPKIYSGTKAMIGDATTWLIALVPIAGGCMVAWQQFKKQMSDNDPADIAHANKRTKQILIATAIGVSAVGLIKWWASYYN
ncbi:conjugal transfer protein [Bacillus cereus]|uniref:conjugal transfer protein n=1 Tax=Bacillus cereus group TaxID=86661 RepID=UPI002112C9A1|nr:MULTISPECIES: conjugal transfer protein [Bacillus cereus group]MCQ6337930.1 conjugal transfer protein [Bacillus cereus]MDF9490796.1 conjugal transfer protein [Bacillus cereus]MDF9513474.1 conjugal transfer protein [Bacillus paranthracis]MDG1620843.1 conjugal transfer protein [Bacillus mobilis]HEF5239018.1 conjugal transfer protein [Bacillus cereus]